MSLRKTTGLTTITLNNTGMENSDQDNYEAFQGLIRLIFIIALILLTWR